VSGGLSVLCLGAKTRRHVVSAAEELLREA